MSKVNKENLKKEIIEKEKTPIEIERDNIKKGKKNDNFLILSKE